MDSTEVLDRNIVGQEFAQRMLANTIRRRRVPHAILLHGPAGTGKLSLARSYAAAVNCTGRGESVSACGACASCHAIKTGNHPDVRIISPDGQRIKIDQIRETIEAVSYRSYSGAMKVWIIRQADSMTEEAANSLLKILEEPPANTVFVLTAENLYSMLPTVVSRCRLVRFSLVPQDLIEDLVASRQGVSREHARVLSYLSGGSVGHALEACADQSFFDERAELIRIIRGLLGKPAFELLNASAQFADAAKKSTLDRVLRILEYWYRDLLMCRTTEDAGRVANIDLIDQIRADAPRYSAVGLITRLNRISEARRQLAANANVGLVMDNLYVALGSAD